MKKKNTDQRTQKTNKMDKDFPKGLWVVARLEGEDDRKVPLYFFVDEDKAKESANNLNTKGLEHKFSVYWNYINHRVRGGGAVPKSLEHNEGMEGAATDAPPSLEPPKKKRRTKWEGHVSTSLISPMAFIDQFFVWKGDPRLSGFRDCTLREDLGAFKAGQKFYRVDLLEERSLMELFLKDYDILPAACFSLQLLAKQIEKHPSY